LLLIEFTLIYGNDFFIIPIDVPVGSLCRTYQLDVVDIFGIRTLIKPTSHVSRKGGPWQMFRISSSVASAASDPPNFLFIPPVLTTHLESTPVEEVVFLRDEMANMVWAVEKVVESQIRQPLKRFEEQRTTR
jgi:hypothetical protein